jgi:hypothetical protein
VGARTAHFRRLVGTFHVRSRKNPRLSLKSEVEQGASPSGSGNWGLAEPPARFVDKFLISYTGGSTMKNNIHTSDGQQ